MATSTYELWYLLEGGDTPFFVIASHTTLIRRVKGLIREQLKDGVFRGVDARYLVLKKVKNGVELEACKDGNGKVRLKTDGVLDPRKRLGEIWPNQPVNGHLHVLVGTSSGIRRGPIIYPHLEPARHLHKELWGTNLHLSPDKVPGCRETYVPRSRVTFLRLRDLGFNEEALLVRNEYVTSLKILTDMSTCYEGVVVTGQRGAGKSCFLFFTLLHRLCNGKPTALQISNSIIIFENNGVTAYEPLYGDPDLLPDGTWALVDSEDPEALPCDTFLMASRGRSAFIVQATSVMASLYTSWTVEGRVLPYVMDTFSPSEFISLGKVLDLDGEALAGHSRRWGPSARICVELQRDPLMFPLLTSKARTAASAFVDGFWRIDELQVMAFSDILFAVRPEGPDMSQRLCEIVTVATDYFNQVLTEATAAADPLRRVKFLKMMTIRPGFESSALYILRRFFCAWFFNGQKSPKLRCSAAPGTRPRFSILPICENVHRMSKFSSLKRANDLQTPFGWLPISQSLAFADAIICTDKYIITIKVTVSSAIKIDRIGLKRLKNNLPSRFQANRKWIHVFVTDDEYKALRIRIREFKRLEEKDISVYSAVLDVHQIALSAEDLARVEEPRETDANAGKAADEVWTT